MDRLYLDRACDLAQRALGSTSPNPVVGAVLVREERVIGEGYHHRAGAPHAEIEALRAASNDARGATIYVTLEPCNHHGRTPPCTRALIEAGVTRVVIGAMDPNPVTAGSGARVLREAGITVDVLEAPRAGAMIEPFARAVLAQRPFVALKMAMSLNGFVTQRPGTQQQLTGEPARSFVRDLRTQFDALAIGAGTLRVDNSRLTVRPPHRRSLPYRRVVFCGTVPPQRDRAIFEALEGYERTLLVVPAGRSADYDALADRAEMLFVGDGRAASLDLPEALHALRARGIASLLCEGGPTLAAQLFERQLVDRFHWIVAPLILDPAQAVPVLAGSRSLPGLRFDRAEPLGNDLLISGAPERRV